ncbi:MAG: 16S rRNA (guanine(527)-N(7))-methyltransferase RsmG [Bacilli bacterium]
MNKNEFINALKKININITIEQLNQLEIYCDYLITKNKEYNLTAIKEPESVYLKHFYDCITILDTMSLDQSTKILDIGTGAGFPGMIIKIIYPEIKLTLLDANNKKITFLKELASKLNLKDINFIHARSEDYYHQVKDSFDYVVSRAVASLPILVELCLPFVKIGGCFIAMKAQATEELEESAYAIKILGGEVENIKKFNLPIENSERTIIKIRKNTKTPEKYPRSYSKIVKYPLKKMTE